MAGGTIAAAIITSLVAAGAASASIVAGELKSRGSYVGGILINESDHDFTVSSYDPSHGCWLDHPNHKLSSVKTIIKMLRQEAETVNGGQPVDDAKLLEYYRDHYIKHNIDQPFVKSAVTTWEMMGANMGSEGLIRLTSPTSNVDLYVLIRKIPAGYFGAGISLITDSWVTKNGMDVASDHTGRKFCDHIRESSNKGPSSYFSTGRTMNVKNGSLNVHFAGAQTSTFIIRPS